MGGKRDNERTNKEVEGGNGGKGRTLTVPDDWGHRKGVVLLACYWPGPPRWSPRQDRQEVESHNRKLMKTDTGTFSLDLHLARQRFISITNFSFE